jgi:hypothetical protein
MNTIYIFTIHFCSINLEKYPNNLAIIGYFNNSFAKTM